MPNCFQLTRNGDKEPSILQHVDDCICQALDIPSNPEEWAWHWFDNIGLMLALGKSFDEIIDAFEGHRLQRVAAYLNEHYTADSWKEWK